MNVLRGLVLDNLGIKLVALLLAVLVYLNVYTDRPATMTVAFPLQLIDLPDSLSLLGPAPAAVRAELRGTAKQLIRLRLTEPPLRVSLAGVGPGRYERSLGPQDLPLPAGIHIEVDRMAGPRTLELQVDRKGRRAVPVAARLEGEPPSTVLWDGTMEVRPGHVEVVGPEGALSALDSVRLAPVSVAGRRDTVLARVAAQSLPEWCVTEPELVEVMVPLEQAVTRRVPVEVEPPRGGEGLRAVPGRVTAIVTAPKRLAGAAAPQVGASWGAPGVTADASGRRAPVRPRGKLPAGVQVRFEPDSITIQRAGS